MDGWNELAEMDGLAQAERVRRGEVTSVELVEAAIGRIERLNPVLNAVVTPMYDEAYRTARAGTATGPFAGAPFLLKDLVAAFRGVRLAAGSALLKDHVPDYDSHLVQGFKKAGLITVGKTNTPELGGHITTEPELFGPTRNPWNVERTTGGSSGGAVAAVASGMVPAAHANDAAGSIRIPASCCGVFGLKPTRARNSLGPDFGDWCNGLAEEHVVSRSVRDSAAILDATAGPFPGDPYWPAPPARPFLSEIDADTGCLRIAFTTRAPNGVPVHPDCVAAVQDAAALCASLGHEVEEADLPIEGTAFIEAFARVFACGVASNIEAILKAVGPPHTVGDLEPLNRYMYEVGNAHSIPEYMADIALMQKMTRDIARFFATYTLWLTPAVTEPPMPLGSFKVTEQQPAQTVYERIFAFIPFTPIANATGQPAMSVPLYWNREQLPVGVHFTGRYGDEATLFRLAAQLEQARPWRTRKPPVSV